MGEEKTKNENIKTDCIRMIMLAISLMEVVYTSFCSSGWHRYWEFT